MANKFEIMINGQKIRRTSQNRIYTHAIVGNRSYEASANFAADLSQGRKTRTSNYHYFHSILNGTCDLWTRYPDLYTPERKAEEIADARKQVENLTLEQYLDKLRREDMVYIEEQYKTGAFKPGVFQWSMNERNAIRAAGTFRRRGIQNVEVVPVGVSITIPPQPGHAFLVFPRTIHGQTVYGIGWIMEGSVCYTPTTVTFDRQEDAEKFVAKLHEAAGITDEEARKIVDRHRTGR